MVASLCSSFAERQSLAWAADRSSRPHRSPGLLSAEAQERICAARRRSGWGPRLVAGETGFAHSTVWKVLHRHGLFHWPRQRREAVCRYEWPCPGDLLHMDTARYARFERPGHRVTGDRSHRERNWMSGQTTVGYAFPHPIVDDHSRLAYVELHDDEKAATVTAFVTRALDWFAEHDVHPQRLMTDNAFSYVHNRSLRELLAAHKINHLRTQAYRPKTNGKIEAFSSDHGQRVGLRHGIPDKSPPRPSAATLARALQPAQATLRDRQPATHHRRSQPTWAGQLATGALS